MTSTPKIILLGGQPFKVHRNAKGVCFIGDETAAVFMERMTLLGRKAILRDLREVETATVQRSLARGTTAWAAHRAREREAGR